MTVFSKEAVVLNSCCEVVHSFHPQCLPAAAISFKDCMPVGLRIYGALYVISAVLKGRSLKYFMTRLPSEVLRSSVFLAANCFFFLGFFCLHRKFFGRISYWGSLLFGFPACFLSILVERKQRRGLLALYLTNLATETAFNMAVFRGLLPRIPNGEVLLFAMGSAIYALLFKMRELDGSLFNMLKIFVGNSEVPDHDHHIKRERQSRVVKYYGFVTDIVETSVNRCYNLISSRRHRFGPGQSSIFFQTLKRFEKRMDNFLRSLNKAHACRHNLCTHRYNCLLYPIMGFIQRFFTGFAIQAGIKIVSSLGLILKKPKVLFKILANPANRDFGLYLGTYVLIFRAVSCLLRWLTNSNNQIHGLITGFFAGFSMIFYKSSSISLYLNFKLLEILWMIGVKYKRLPLFKSFDVLLYTISTGFILWFGLFEPHNIRPAYWRFLLKISNQNFGKVNHQILDAFGTHPSIIDKIATK